MICHTGYIARKRIWPVLGTHIPVVSRSWYATSILASVVVIVTVSVLELLITMVVVNAIVSVVAVVVLSIVVVLVRRVGVAVGTTVVAVFSLMTFIVSVRVVVVDVVVAVVVVLFRVATIEVSAS